MTDIREKAQTIKTRVEQLLAQHCDMSTFGTHDGAPIGFCNDHLPDCGSPACLAGAICQAAQEHGFVPSEVAVSDHGSPFITPRYARAVWRDLFGSEEADRLGFYEEEWGMTYEEMKAIPAETVIAHLNGEPTPFDHEGFDVDGCDRHGVYRSEYDADYE